LKKDIHFPNVKDVYIAIVKEEHPEYKTQDWNAYIINNSDADLDTVLIVSQGFSEKKVTPPMRHSLKLLPARSFAKIEYLQDAVLQLHNEFKVTYFQGNVMFDKTYLFNKDSIKDSALKPVPLIQIKGILAQ